MDPEEQARLAAQRVMQQNLGGAPGPQPTGADLVVPTQQAGVAGDIASLLGTVVTGGGSMPAAGRQMTALGTPVQGEGRWSPPTAAPAATEAPSAAAVTTEAAPAAPTWDPTARPTGRGTARPADPFAASLAEYRRRHPGQIPQQGDPEWTEIIAQMGQRVQGARDAGNEAVNAQAQENNARTMMEEQQRNDELQRRQQAIEERVNEVSNMRVDPSNWFSSRGTVGAFGAAIAVGLGAAAQSLQGGNGPNNALNIINAAIDRDMTAQQQNIQNAQAGVRNQVTALEQLRQTYGSDRAAREAFRMRSLQIAERQAEQAVQRAQTPQARELSAQVQQSIAGDIEKSRLNLQNQLALQQNAQEFDLVKMQAAYQARPRGGGGSRQQPFSQAQVQNAQQVNATLRAAVPGQSDAYYQAGTQRILREGIGAAPENFVPTLNRLQQQAQAGSGTAAQTNAQNALAAMQQSNRSQVNALLNSNRDLGGFGPVDDFARRLGTGRDQGAIGRTLEQGLQSALVGTGIANPNIDPPLLAEIERVITKRNELYGAAQGDGEVQAGLPVLPDFTSMTEAQLRRSLPAISSNLDRSERMLQLRQQANQRQQRPAGQRGPFVPPEE